MPNIITITGRSASGKSTLTELLRKKLPAYIYVDRPNIKRGLKPLGRELALRVSKEATYNIIRKIMKLGKNIIAQEVSTISLKKKLKHYLKMYDYQIVSFYIQCSLEETLRRDKNRQKKSRQRLIKRLNTNFPGPSENDIIIDTEKLGPKQSIKLILKNIK